MADAVEFDFSGIQEAVTGTPSAFKPPRHVYFGRRDPNSGQMEDEPVYAHKAFPQMLYKKVNGKIAARIVQDKAAADALKADGFVDSPAALGVITAPSHDQIQGMKAGVVDAPLGLPAKAKAA